MTYLIKIDSTDISSYLKGYTVERNKLWTDADRNLAGDLKATFIGIFPKIKLEFVHTTEAQLKTIMGLLDPASVTVSYWDSASESYNEASYYASDYGVPMFDKTKQLYEGFEVSLIPYKKE